MEHNFFALGWRQLLRDWRAGELRLLLVAVALAVAALTSVSFFSDRLQAGLQRDASQLLGGDVVVVSDNRTPATFSDKAQALGLKGVTTVTFPTMARADDADGGDLVRNRQIASGKTQHGQRPQGRLQRVGAHRQRHIRAAQAVLRNPVAVDQRRARMRHRPAHHAGQHKGLGVVAHRITACR